MSSESLRTYHAAQPSFIRALDHCFWIIIIVSGLLLSYQAATQSQSSLAVLILVLVAGLIWITYRNCRPYFIMSFSIAEIRSGTVMLRSTNGIVFEARLSELSITLLGFFGETYEVGQYSSKCGRIRLEGGGKRIEMSAERWEPFWRDLLQAKNIA